MSKWLKVTDITPRSAAQGLSLTVLFISSVYLALNEKVGAATLMTTFFVALYLLTNLERLKKLSVLGLNAELRDTIKEVEATIDQVRDLALVSAKQTFFQYALQGRFSAKWTAKNNAIKEINKNLSDLGVTKTRSRSIRKPIFEYALIDFIYKFCWLVNLTLSLKGVDPSKLYSASNFDEMKTMSDIVRDVRADDRLSSEEKSNLIAVSKRFAVYVKEGEAAGYLSDEAISVLDSESSPGSAKLIFSREKA